MRKAVRLIERAVPSHPQPGQIGFDGLFIGLGGALCVGVVNAQDEGPVLAFGEQPIDQSRADIADMQTAGRRRRKAYHWRCHTLTFKFMRAPCTRNRVICQGLRAIFGRPNSYPVGLMGGLGDFFNSNRVLARTKLAVDLQRTIWLNHIP